MIDIKTQANAVSLIRNELLTFLGVANIDETSNLIEAGISSIMVMSLVNKLKKFGVKIPFAKLIENPTLEEWRKHIAEAEPYERKTRKKKKSAAESFALTDVQYAYWVGRDDSQPLGGVGCHAYLEFDGKNVDPDRLRSAWRAVQSYHPMLRARFTDDGRQAIMSNPYKDDIDVYDLRAQPESEVQTELSAIREKLSHRKLRVEFGEVAGAAIALLSGARTRVFLDVDLLVADVMSLSILIRDLAKAYNNESLGEPQTITFRDYIEGADIEESAEAQAYWKEKLKDFPKEAPGLPLKRQPETLAMPRFTRRKRIINRDTWSAIQERTTKNHATPSMFLLTCYALILERWCNQKTLLINVPLFNRDTEDERFQNMAADFTNLLLVEYKRQKNDTFLDSMARISKTFTQNAAHSSYSGVRVQRDVFKELGSSGFIAPIVFACNIDYPLETPESESAFGSVSYMISQTPQVWLDFQTYVKDGELSLCWDVVDDLFSDWLIDDMFGALAALVEALAQTDNWNVIFDVLPEKQKEIRKAETEKILPLAYPKKLLYSGFEENVRRAPDAAALIDGITGKTITYVALYRRALEIASKLIENGVSPGDYVGVTLPRGYKQAQAILGILFAGAAYVPIGINQPADRRAKIIEQIGISYILTDTDTLAGTDTIVAPVNMDESASDTALNAPLNAAPGDSAYVVMTSGSTGVPKGVEISHRSAVNTIDDINGKHSVSEKDAVIMVSAIDFDLSVYDIFGLLSAGGSIVIPDESTYKDPQQWLKYIDLYNVTLWNSVPILFDMLVTMAEGFGRALPLRTVMLSGDWIALDLPGRFYSRSDEDSIVVAMGGATEASIWSNYIEVPRELPGDWISIPYGRPLKNQVYRVVDDLGRVCPNFVPGELWIGGVGVAKGYRGDKTLSALKFADDIMPWYKTGDMGRTWADGIIEFLGRRDSQVKIKGHRIELGEIEDAVKSYAGVKSVTVDVVGKNTEDKRLAAFIEAPGGLCETVYAADRLSAARPDFGVSVSDWSAARSFERIADNTCIRFILGVFREQGVFADDTLYSGTEIFERLNVTDAKAPVITLWLNILTQKGFISNEGNEHKLVNEAPTEVNTEIETYLERLKPYVTSILNGKASATEVFYDDALALSPTHLMKLLPNSERNCGQIVELASSVFAQLGKGAKVLEMGTRDIQITEQLVQIAMNAGLDYTYADTSVYFESPIRLIQKTHPALRYEILAMDSAPLSHKHGYDCVLAINSIHRSKQLETAFKSISSYLKPMGYLIGGELAELPLLQAVTATLLEDGFAGIKDRRSESGRVIPTAEDIAHYAAKAEFIQIHIVQADGLRFFTVNKASVKMPSAAGLKAHLESKLPTYMIPDKFIVVEEFPITGNGKLDRKKLLSLCDNSKVVATNTESVSETENQIKGLWKQIFNVAFVSVNDNYFALGGDSLVATRLITLMQDALDIKVPIGSIFEYPTIRELAAFIDKQRASASRQLSLIKAIAHDAENAYKPFPLTDVQYAYWIGRRGFYNLGNVSTHCYFELDTKDVNVEALETAWNRLISHHGMMRAVILPTGEQKILREVPRYAISVYDLSHCSEGETQLRLLDIRGNMSHQVLDVERWPVFDIKMSKLANGKGRLHISFDNIAFDGWSMFCLLNQWQSVYQNPGISLPTASVSFRDYVLGLEKLKTTAVYETHRKYWIDRLNSLPSAPQLPIAKSENEITNQLFARRTDNIPEESWTKLKTYAKTFQITPSTLLVTAYAEALRVFVSQESFTINLTRFDRAPLHPEINAVVGDFTSLTLLEAHFPETRRFLEQAVQIQKQLAADLEHALYSAVDMQRELRRLHGRNGSVMPIVFTSGLGIDQWEDGKWPGTLAYNISQTPQVWIDCQVVEKNGGLALSWDVLDELFPSGLADEMFAVMTMILETLAASESAFQLKCGDFIKRNERECHQNVLRAMEEAAAKLPDVKEAAAIELSGERYLFIGAGSERGESGDQLRAALKTAVAAIQKHPRPDNRAAIESLCADVMVAALRLEEQQKPFKAKELIYVKPNYQKLLLKWLQYLTEAGYLTQDGTYYACTGKAPRDSNLFDDDIKMLARNMRGTIPAMKALLTGDKTVAEVIEGGTFKLLPSALSQCDPYAEIFTDIIGAAFETALCSKSLPLCLEIGARYESQTAMLLERLGERGRYVYADEAVSYADEARKRFEYCARFESLVYNFRQEELYNGELEGTADIVIADNALHRAYDLETALVNIKRLMKPDAILIMREFTVESQLLYTTAAFLEDGFSGIKDERRESGNPLLSVEDWRRLLDENGFDCIYMFTPSDAQSALFVARRVNGVNAETRSEIEHELHMLCPAADNIIVLDRLPKQENGVVSHDKLTQWASKTVRASNYLSPGEEREIPGELIEKIAETWRDILNINHVGLRDNFFDSGGDSLKAVKLMNALKQRHNIDMQLNWLFETPDIRGLTERICFSETETYDADEGEL
jgi:yersiniabactin nonribosomal peptide synthetase